MIDTNDTYENFIKDCPDYDFIETTLPPVRRIIVLGDIHGDYNLALKLLKIAKLINDELEWTGGDTHVVQVGDQIDKCRPNGIYLCNKIDGTPNDENSDIKILEFFTELHKKALKHGGMVISLFGNHEIMNIMGQLDYVSYLGIKGFENYIDEDGKIYKNGFEGRAKAFSPNEKIGKFLGCTRKGLIIIGSNLFVHAGIIPNLLDKLKINKKNHKEKLSLINIYIRKWLVGVLKINVKTNLSGVINSFFWNRILGNIKTRASLDYEMCKNYVKPVLTTLEINNIIIGHTPQFILDDGINGTCDDHVWRVDTGSSESFNPFDKTYVNTGIVSPDRMPQVLEILNDTTFRILY